MHTHTEEEEEQQQAGARSRRACQRCARLLEVELREAERGARAVVRRARVTARGPQHHSPALDWPVEGHVEGVWHVALRVRVGAQRRQSSTRRWQHSRMRELCFCCVCSCLLLRWVHTVRQPTLS
jgi:hypothetical protein